MRCRSRAAEMRLGIAALKLLRSLPALPVQATYEKLLTEVPKYKMITPSVLSDRLRVRAYAGWMPQRFFQRFLQLRASLHVLVRRTSSCSMRTAAVM